MKKRYLALAVLPLLALTGCDALNSSVDGSNSDANPFNLNEYNQEAAIENLLEKGSEVGFEITFTFKHTQDIYALEGDEVVETKTEYKNEYTLGVRDEAYWVYRQNIVGEEDNQKFGVATEGEYVYTYKNSKWVDSVEEDVEILNYFTEAEGHLSLDGDIFDYVLKDGTGPTNGSVAGRAVSRYTYNLTGSNTHTIVASIAFDSDLGILLATSITETYSGDTSSTTDVKTLEVSSFTIGAQKPNLPVHNEETSAQ